MAQPTHRHDVAHRGLVPVGQLASGTPTTNMVPAYNGTLNAIWSSLGSLGVVTNPMTTQDDVIVGGSVTGGVAAPARLGKGTDGQVLTVDPTTHHLIWATPAAQRAASSTTPAAVGTAAVGTGTTDARADHVHATGAGTPSTQAFGDAAATGTGPAAAMTDHKHAMPANPVAYAAPALTLGTANAAGSAGSAVRTDATILAFDTTNPSTQASADAPAVGTATVAARRDHKHGMPTIGSGVATDAIWDAAGDLAVGTGADTAAKLTKGADGTALKMDAATHLPVWMNDGWVSSSSVAIGTGGKTFSVAYPERYVQSPDAYVRVYADASHIMWGFMTGITPGAAGSITIGVDAVAGSGTFGFWSMSVEPHRRSHDHSDASDGTALTPASVAAAGAVSGGGINIYASDGGAAFPTGAALATYGNNRPFFRTDLGESYYYDGTRWLSTTLYQEGWTNFMNAAQAATISAYVLPMPTFTSDIYAVDYMADFCVNSGGTALGASHKWVGTLGKFSYIAALTTIGTINIDSGNSANFRLLTANINAALTAGSYFGFKETWTKTGTPGTLQPMSRLTYRRIAV